MGEGQQFCLRWNNHSANFVTVFEQLLRANAFTDVTVVSYDGPPIKCHKMVLAACSAYFQELFMKNSCEHPIIILSNVKHIELEAILNYMYRGEVNIEGSDINELLKVAIFLKVKGLVDESLVKLEEPDNSTSPAPAIGTTTNASGGAAASSVAAQSSGYVSPTQHLAPSSYYNGKSGLDKAQRESSSHLNGLQQQQQQQQLPAHHPHLPYWAGLAAAFPGMPKPHHVYDDKALAAETPAGLLLQQPQHPVLSSTYDNAAETSPLTKKKQHSSHFQQHANAILRSVLADSSQAMSTSGAEPERSDYGSPHNRDNDRRNSAEMSEDERRNSPRNYAATTSAKSGGSSSTRPEWKRYKQYTRENITDAMTAVREKKMSALQAARHYKVPSRTLYDKLKKAGILPSRNSLPRGSGTAAVAASIGVGLESSARFPYSASSINGSVYGNNHSLNGSVCDNGSEHENDTFNGYASDSYARDHDITGGSSGPCDNPESPDEVMDMSSARNRRNSSPPPLRQIDHPALASLAATAAASARLNGVEVGGDDAEDEGGDGVEDLSVNRGSSVKEEDSGLSNDVSVIKSLPVKKEDEDRAASLEDSSSRH